MDQKEIERRIMLGRSFVVKFGDEEGVDQDYATDQELKKPQPPLFKAPMTDRIIDLPTDFSGLAIDGDFLHIINTKINDALTILTHIFGKEIRDEDFASFFKHLIQMFQCPDTWAENGKTVLIYKDKNDEGYLSIVPEEGLVTYIKYDDPDNCEVIMQDKGCVSNEDMADLKEFWNLIVSMTD